MKYTKEDIKETVNEMISKFKDTHSNLEALEADGEAGAGMVKLTINGVKAIKKVEISDELLNKDSKQTLEDLIVAAYNVASVHIENKISEQYKETMMSVLPKEIFGA